MATKAKEKKKKKSTKDENVLDLDNEIIIGIKTLPEPKVPKQKKTSKKANKSKNIKKQQEKLKQKEEVKQKKRQKENAKQKERKNGSKSKTTKNRRNIKNNSKQSKQKMYEEEFELKLGIEDEEIKNKNKQKQKKKKTPKQQEIARQKRKKVFRFVKWTAIFAIIIGGTIYFMLSPFFNIKNIQVTGNEKIASEEIISLSGIQLEQNTFQLQKNEIRQAIKQNAYIDTVTIRRNWPDGITIEVTERTPTYMLSFGNGYVYINNQGYLLEISQEKLDTPIITGYLTSEEDIKAGNRLCTDDLERLNDLLQIMKSMESNSISDLVTQINIADKQDYILTLEKEKKIVHMGDTSNLSTKIPYIIKIIEENKDIEGEIFVNTDLSNKGAIFRRKV